MDSQATRGKFGDAYAVDERTFVMGIDQRLAGHIAERFACRVVLETCTGAGLTTIQLARVANRVIGVEVNPDHLAQARANLERAGVQGSVTLVGGDILDEAVLVELPAFDAAFLDPDWAVAGEDHVYRFRDSNTVPAADVLLKRILEMTQDVALVLPPLVNTVELVELPPHECEALYLDGSHELYCIYFGDLADQVGCTEYRV